MLDYYCYVYYDQDWIAYYVGKGYRNRKRATRKLQVPPNEQIQTFYFSQEWEAYECEIDLIHFWGRKQDGGSLENVALGGPGCPGVIPNNETRARISIARLKLPNANEIITKMRLARIRPISLIHCRTNQQLSFESGEAACQALGLTKSALSEVRSGKRKSHKGWKLND